MINWNLLFNLSYGDSQAWYFITRKSSGRQFLRNLKLFNNSVYTELYRAIKQYGTENVRDRCRKAYYRRYPERKSCLST